MSSTFGVSGVKYEPAYDRLLSDEGGRQASSGLGTIKQMPQIKSPSHKFLTTILGGIQPANFFAEFFGLKPLFQKSCASGLISLGTSQLCEKLVTCDSVDFFAVRDGKPHPGGRPGADEAQRLFKEGSTWVFREAERGDAALADLGRTLASEIHGALHLHVYRTPASHGGFGWHCDPEDVFFIQTAGRKILHLRENTLHPLPLLDRMPTNLRPDFERTGISRYRLEAGDWLYIPRGFWHAAEAVEDSISISVGILVPSLIDAVALLVKELAQEPRWRQRLPPVGLATTLTDVDRQRIWSEPLRELGDELSRRLASDAGIAKLFAMTGWWARR